MNEVQNHETYLIDKNRKPLATVSKTKLKGKSVEKKKKIIFILILYQKKFWILIIRKKKTSKI